MRCLGILPFRETTAMNYGNGRESGSLVIGHAGKAARRFCPTSLLCNVGASYSEAPGVEIL